jgi:hypothetical protein
VIRPSQKLTAAARLALSIMLTEIFTVFLPCWEILRHKTLKEETLHLIAKWEKKNSGKAAASSSNSNRSLIADADSTADHYTTAVTGHPGHGCSSQGSTWTRPRTNAGESMLTMSALEHVLERNPAPL